VWRSRDPLTVCFNPFDWRKGGKWLSLVVECSFGRVGSSWGHRAFFGSSWGKKIITPNINPPPNEPHPMHNLKKWISKGRSHERQFKRFNFWRCNTYTWLWNIFKIAIYATLRVTRPYMYIDVDIWKFSTPDIQKQEHNWYIPNKGVQTMKCGLAPERKG